MKSLIMASLMTLTMGCATMGQKGPPNSISDVSAGDVLTLTVKGNEDCTFEVYNIATYANTPFGPKKMKPQVCGALQCESSIPEAKKPVVACMLMSAFVPQKD